MVVHEHLRVPAQDTVHHGSHFGLALRQEVAVHVEAEVAVAPRDAPGLALLEGGGLIRADGDRVVPGCKALVAVRVGGGVQHQHHVLEDLLGGRLVGSEQLVGHLQAGLEPGGLVAVD